MKKALKKTARQGLLLLLFVTLVLGGGFLVLLGLQQLENEHFVPNVPSNVQNVTYKGENYALNKNVESVLIMGLDKYQRPQGAQGYLNDYQSDLMFLLVMNHDAKTYDLLHLDRDTMTQIHRLGVGGADSVFVGQLGVAHAYGSGGSDSCLNAVKAVSDLLDGVPIQHYLTLKMDNLARLNDLVGGVEVELLDDFTAMDPAMIKGQRVTLNGEQTLTYIRGLENGNDVNRMSRQRQYIQSLFQKIAEHNNSLLLDVALDLGGKLVSDMSVVQIGSMFQTISDYSMDELLVPEGNAVAGQERMEFHVDPELLKEMVIRTFYKKIS